jgi:hypothetical protein
MSQPKTQGRFLEVMKLGKLLIELAGPTGLEPATSDVTGQRSSQLNYDPATCLRMVGGAGIEPATSSL